jgi:hypothetical protein
VCMERPDDRTAEAGCGVRRDLWRGVDQQLVGLFTVEGVEVVGASLAG